jgi:cyclase
MIRKCSILILLLIPISLFSQRNLSNARIDVTELAPNLYRFYVESVALMAYIGDDGILLVDAAFEQSSNRLKEEIEKISKAPIRYIINTHIHADHTGGNIGLGKGVDIISHYTVKEHLSKEHTRGDRTTPAHPKHAIPNITFTENMFLDFNGQSLEIYHLYGGHTEGDVIVYFPESKILAVGDLLFANYFPFIDTRNDGHPLRFVDNLRWIIHNFPADVTFVGGHGQIQNMTQLAEYHTTLIETMDVIEDAKDRGLSLEQMKENRILEKWESMGKFFITEDLWIETIYPFI